MRSRGVASHQRAAIRGAFSMSAKRARLRCSSPGLRICGTWRRSIRSFSRRVVLTMTLLLAALFPGRADAHGVVGYRYSSVPHWAHYQPARHRSAHHFVDRIVRRTVNRRVYSAPVRTAGSYRISLYTTYYCLRGITASGRLAGPGIVASYILPWGAYVRDLTTGWQGYVLDHPDALTQADEWMSCGQSFPTGFHVWEVYR